MSLAGLSPLWCAAVFAGAVGALIALHLLRIRRRRQPVVTVMFWRQAVAGVRAPTLLQRFQHRGTFALLTTILALLAIALSGPVWRSTDASSTVLVVDAGYTMDMADGSAKRMDLARARAAEYAASAGGDVAVVVADPEPRIVLGFAQPSAAVARVLGDVSPAAAPAACRPALELARSMLSGREGRIFWITDRPSVPDDLDVAAVPSIQRVTVGRPGPNAAVLSAVYEPSREDPSLGRVRVRIGQAHSAARLRVVGPDFEQAVDVAADSVSEVVIPGIRADGSLMRVQVDDGRGPVPDDSVEIRLPRRPPLRFNIAYDAPAALKAAVLAIGQASQESDAIAVGKATGRGIVVMPAGENPNGAATVWGPGVNFEGATSAAGRGLSSLPGETVLAAGDAPLALLDIDGGRLVLADAVVADGSVLPHRAAFLVMLSQACRRLAGWTDAPLVLPMSRRQVDPAGTPETATVIVADGVGGAPVDAAAEATPSARSPSRIEPFEVLLAVALGLLLVEGWLFVRGRVV